MDRREAHLVETITKVTKAQMKSRIYGEGDNIDEASLLMQHEKVNNVTCSDHHESLTRGGTLSAAPIAKMVSYIME